jgi:hypothetical protein
MSARDAARLLVHTLMRQSVARKRRHPRAPDLAIHHANLDRREEGTRVFRELPLESHERGRSPHSFRY